MRGHFHGKIKNLLHDGFVKPLRSPGIVALYGSTIIALTGMIMVNIFILVELTSMGMAELMGFLLMFFASINLLFIPSGFLALRYVRAEKFFLSLILVQAVSLYFFMGIEAPSAQLIGLSFAINSAPFWLLYHMGMMSYTSGDNRGNEVSVAHLCMTLGIIIGSVSSGYFLSSNVEQSLILFAGFALSILATLLLYFFTKTQGLFKHHDNNLQALSGRGFIQAFINHPERSKATIAEMLHDVVTGTLWPVWMKLIGASSMAIGLLCGATVAMKFVLSPIVGRFVNLRNGLDSQYGPMIKLVGWLPWLFIVHPLTSLWSSIFFAAGSHIFKIGLEARWYESKTYTHLAVREFLLGTGRLIATIIMVPIMFYATQYYILAGVFMTALVLFSGIQLRRSLILSAAE